MKLFGGVLPFVGFREVPVDDDMRQFFKLSGDYEVVNTFQVEWFNCGLVLVLDPVPDDE